MRCGSLSVTVNCKLSYASPVTITFARRDAQVDVGIDVTERRETFCEAQI